MLFQLSFLRVRAPLSLAPLFRLFQEMEANGQPATAHGGHAAQEHCPGQTTP